MNVIHAPDSFANAVNTIFLAGSIEMGVATDWQSLLVDLLQDYNVTFLNPRRPDWDSSWEQKAGNANFAQQVNWELDALQQAEVILFYFDPNTKSPVSLLELGLFATSKKLAVCCPEGFWRKGNVDIVCQRFNVPMVETINELADFAKRFIRVDSK
jgi:hypothetical protein